MLSSTVKSYDPVVTLSRLTLGHDTSSGPHGLSAQGEVTAQQVMFF